jgi:hypothetical protein
MIASRRYQQEKKTENCEDKINFMRAVVNAGTSAGNQPASGPPDPVSKQLALAGDQVLVGLKRSGGA